MEKKRKKKIDEEDKTKEGRSHKLSKWRCKFIKKLLRQ